MMACTWRGMPWWYGYAPLDVPELPTVQGWLLLPRAPLRLPEGLQ
jgi:hypothetical protein